MEIPMYAPVVTSRTASPSMEEILLTPLKPCMQTEKRLFPKVKKVLNMIQKKMIPVYQLKKKILSANVLTRCSSHLQSASEVCVGNYATYSLATRGNTWPEGASRLEPAPSPCLQHCRPVSREHPHDTCRPAPQPRGGTGAPGMLVGNAEETARRGWLQPTRTFWSRVSSSC